MDSPQRPGGPQSLLQRLTSERGDAIVVTVAVLWGLFAFAWAGFVVTGRYSRQQAPAQLPFTDLWPLFLWLCFLIFAVELTILGDPDMPRTFVPARKTVATLAVTLIFILAIIAAWLYGWHDTVQRILDALKRIGPLSVVLPVVLPLINLALIVIFWIGALLLPYRPDPASRSAARYVRAERLAGDLLAGVIFSLLLAPVFFAPPLRLVSEALRLSPITPCYVRWLPTRCPTNIGPADPSTLSFFDLVILPLIYLGLALLIIIIVAVLNARRMKRPEGFLMVVVETVAGMLRRLLSLPSLLARLRIFWPGFVLVAAVAATVCSIAIQQFLNLSTMANKSHVVDTSVLCRDLDCVFGNFDWRLAAPLAGTVALLAAVAAVAVQIIPWFTDDLSPRQKMSYALGHVSFYGLLLVFSYWVFSLLLSVVNQLGLTVNIVVGHMVLSLGSPFTQPDPLAVLSFTLFLLYLGRLMRRRARDRETKKSAPMGEG